MHLGKEYYAEDDREYSGDDIRAIFTEAEEHLTEKIPQRANFLQQKQAWQNDTSKCFRIFRKGMVRIMKCISRYEMPNSTNLFWMTPPNVDFLAATIVKG